jgi:hypothetical protein
LEINTSGLQRNQSSDSRSADCINLCQVKHDIPPLLLHSRAQNSGLIATYNAAQAVQNHDFTEGFDSNRQHASILPDLAAHNGHRHCRRMKSEYQALPQ